MPKDVLSYLNEQQINNQEGLSSTWAELENLYTKKLWHELTLKLQEFVKNPVFESGDGLMKMYENFISDIEHKINPLSLVELVTVVSRQIADYQENLAFVEKIKDKVKHSPEALILCLINISKIQLQEKDFKQAKVYLNEADDLIKKIDGVSSVHSRFYDLSSTYHFLTRNHAEYYREALRFLGCSNLSDISVPEQRYRAFHLGIAAILGDGVYNFGELLAHPVLDTLKGTDEEWLINLLYAFNSGNIGQFESLRSQWSNQDDLKANEGSMRDKITLLCLMEMAFRRPASNRQLTFKEISADCRIPINQVEILVMKCLSLGLVKGCIDEPQQRVHIHWVQPRVLNQSQIGVIYDRLVNWCKDIKDMELLLVDHAQEIVS